MTGPDPRRLIPRTDVLLADARFGPALERLGIDAVKSTITRAQQLARDAVIDPEQVLETALNDLPASPTSLRPVINATGVVLHTNLGRAALSASALEAIEVAAGYVDVEFDLADGRRATRGRGTLTALRRLVAGAGDVLVVNNGAAALVLITTMLAAGREVIISRGELVEIGDGFRLPDLIRSTGATIREVGTTNRTNVEDYRAAVRPDTGCILKIHPSNFRIDGFTSSVGIEALAELGVPVVADIGSGLLTPHPLLPDEPDVSSTLRAGADLVSCSGDKLLGGPQAGLIFGRADLVGALRRHPLARALRVDKLTLAALEATVTGPDTPTARYLEVDPAELRLRCETLARALTAAGIQADVVPSGGAVGGGSAPQLMLAGWAVAISPDTAEPLRHGDVAVVARIEGGRCLLDLRCVPIADDGRLAAAVLAAHGW
ncbi:MAG: selenocysteine synthase [Pseudonocardiales bacterium]|nr:selenocysteine synthase [Pseudonocardiales bacterium]